jgi:hypothetical protein
VSKLSALEKITSEFTDDDVRACKVSVGSLLAKSTIMCTKCLYEIESPVITSRTQKNLGRGFIRCGKYNKQI